ncbi:hypothetical protein QBC43DRAFT_100039 [Cladorrhinum sp. PSN259]|nr:hypothetical protein QBC43DRAFT_100039 [Cladorrhinum sp. PSN259]
MAVLPFIPGLDVTVVVDGVDAQEYDPPEDENDEQQMKHEDFDPAYVPPGAIPHIVRYIEAKPGAPYQYRLTLNPIFHFRSHHAGFSAQNDAHKGGVQHVFKSTTPERPVIGQIHKSTVGNAKEGYNTVRFRFAPISLVESDNLKASDIQEQMKATKEFGCLKVRVFRLDEGEKYILDRIPARDPYSEQPLQFSEKALKGRAVDCVTSFTEEPSSGRGATYKRNYTDRLKRPFALFEFRYRSKKGLMAEGIIPRPVEIVDKDEAAEDHPIIKPDQSTLDRVQRMSDAEARRRLAELMEQNMRGSPAIKREAPMDDAEFSARYKTRKLNNGQVEIDLTDD